MVPLDITKTSANRGEMDTHKKRYEVDLEKLGAYPVTKRGADILQDPLLNKGTCFTIEERKALKLHGLLPPCILTMEEQLQRIRENYDRQQNKLDRFVFLEALHDRSETLYYRFLVDNLEELTPIVYTPTVGEACDKFGHIYRQSRGMYFSDSSQGHFREMMDSWPQDAIEIIVVTDGSRILGLGDLGTNGMGIPIGKLALYIACAGIYPSKTLPVVLDVGTNNEKLLGDDLYLGEKHRRLQGDNYYDLVQEFMLAAHDRWPNALIQFEDFSNDHAFLLLHKYQSQYLCFNDDIQGTGAAVLAGLLAALRTTGKTLHDQKFIFFGAGAAAVGVADMIVAGMVEEGLTVEQARERFWFLDTKGLVTTTRGDTLAAHKIPYARNEACCNTLFDVVRKVKPTVLMGLSMQPGAFTEEVVREMHKYTEKPIIFALSNPTSKAECTPQQAYAWTGGSAIYASGSPFDPIECNGRTIKPGQANNMYIFPGVGLGVIISKSRRVTNSMFYAAAKRLSSLVTEEALQRGDLYPPLQDIRMLSAEIAAAVWETSVKEGLTSEPKPENVLQYIRERMYQPTYIPYKAV